MDALPPEVQAAIDAVRADFARADSDLLVALNETLARWNRSIVSDLNEAANAALNAREASMVEALNKALATLSQRIAEVDRLSGPAAHALALRPRCTETEIRRDADGRIIGTNTIELPNTTAARAA